MRRFLCVVIAMTICASLLTSCNKTNGNQTCDHSWERTANLNEYTAVDKCSICGVTRLYTDPDSIQLPDADDIQHSGYEAGFKMLRYSWDGYGIGQKEIYTCDLGYAIIDCLSKLEETGDVVPEISEDVVNEFTSQLPIERGTV